MSDKAVEQNDLLRSSEKVESCNINENLGSFLSQPTASSLASDATSNYQIGVTANRKREFVFSETGSLGWNNVKKRLGTLVAVRTVMDAQKKPKARKPVGQKDFLEKFSTREVNHVRAGKRNSSSNHGRRVSVVVSAPINVVPTGKEENRERHSTEQLELDDMKAKDTMVVDRLCENDQEEEDFMSPFYHFVYTYIEPYSNFLYYWLYVVITAIHYNAWVIFLRIAFTDAQDQYQSFWMTLDYIFDIIYVMDIVICLRTSFLEDGIYVDDLKRMALAYIKSYHFAFDFASVLPLDLLYFAIGINPALRLPRMLKYYKIFTSQKTILALTTYPNVVRTCSFLHLMLIMMHWNACFYFMISKFEGIGINEFVYPKFNENNTALIHQYALCYYWSTLSLTTIGGSAHPVTTIEFTYMIICYAIGIFIFASIVGQAGNVIQNMNASRIEFEKQRDSSMQYMKRHNVPSEMQRRVRLWYDYSYSRGRFQGGGDINDMVLLPNKMKTELALHVHLETLRRVTFLQKCQPEFLHDLVLKMKMIIFTPGDYICRKGEIAREMYVISDGILEVISESGRILKVLYSGDFFGEIGILSLSKGQNRRTADVRAYGYVELFVLSKDEVLNAIKEYPNAQKILAKHGRNRLKKDNNRNDGQMADTTSESDEDLGSMYLNLSSSTGLSKVHDARSSPDPKCASFRRASARRDKDGRRGSNLKIPIATELDTKGTKSSRVLPISEKFTQSKSVVHGAMMSVINPILKPASNVMAGVKSPSLSEKRHSYTSVLVNNDAVEAEDLAKRKRSSLDSTSGKGPSVDTDKIIEILQSSQEELLTNMKTILKKELVKSQRKLLERVEQLEIANCKKDDEIRSLKELLSNPPECQEEAIAEVISSDEEPLSPTSPKRNYVEPTPLVVAEKSRAPSPIPEVSIQ